VLKLPHEGFNRKIGVFAGRPINPEGELVSGKEWDDNFAKWLPNMADGDFIQSLMKPCLEPGKFAGWIAPPKVGIDNKSGDFEYVKLHMA
jgi:benzoyl-CoA 2,3-dioxygenase component B